MSTASQIVILAVYIRLYIIHILWVWFFCTNVQKLKVRLKWHGNKHLMYPSPRKNCFFLSWIVDLQIWWPQQNKNRKVISNIPLQLRHKNHRLKSNIYLCIPLAHSLRFSVGLHLEGNNTFKMNILTKDISLF